VTREVILAEVTRMKLLVRMPDGELVAEVLVDPDCPFGRSPADSFVIGQFVPGPAFPRLRKHLDAFHAEYDTGDSAAASALHEEIDRLGLVAVDEHGKAYRIWNVVFQQKGLLFCADSESAS
jgi:hypothetical protein